MKKTAHYQTIEFEKVRSLFQSYSKEGNGKSPTVLDFGCGKGKFLELFSSLGFAVTGTDISAAYIEEVSAKGYKALSLGVVFNDKAAYDFIFLSHIIEHIDPTNLVQLIPKLVALLAPGGRLILITPTDGQRFYHDFSHVRPYLPQSVRHAFGQTGAPISFGESKLVELQDIYFFKDPYRTRLWRSFYVGRGLKRKSTKLINDIFDLMWRVSGGRVGVTASWCGVYTIIHNNDD